jgi:hypothetical protein
VFSSGLEGRNTIDAKMILHVEEFYSFSNGSANHSVEGLLGSHVKILASLYLAPKDGSGKANRQENELSRRTNPFKHS